MPDQDKRVPSNQELDDLMQFAIVDQVLTEYPDTFTLSELVRRFTRAKADPSFSERDTVNRAIKELAISGVFHLENGRVQPSEAALRLHRLVDQS